MDETGSRKSSIMFKAFVNEEIAWKEDGVGGVFFVLALHNVCSTGKTRSPNVAFLINSIVSDAGREWRARISAPQ